MFRKGIVGSYTSLDPAKSFDAVKQEILYQTQDTLLSLDEEQGVLKPSAAKSYDVRNDGLEIRFELRDDLYFGNGERILAKDYAFALKRLLEEKSNKTFESVLSNIEGAQELRDGMFFHPDKLGIRASIENKTSVLTITLERPDPMLLMFFAHPSSMPIQEKSFSKLGQDYFEKGLQFASGPFVFEKKSDRFFVFAKNIHHRRAKDISLTQVQLFVFDTQKKAERSFLKGKIDQVGTREMPVSSDLVQSLQGSDVLLFQPDLRTVFLRFNQRSIPSNSFDFRRALSMAINREEIKQLALHAHEHVSFSMTPDRRHMYEPPHSYFYDLEGAISVLSKMGFCTSKNTKDCLRLPRLELAYPDTLMGKKLVVLLQKQWKKLGFAQIDLRPMSSSDLVSHIQSGRFGIAMDEIAVSTYDFFDLLQAFSSDSSASVGVQNSNYDALLDKARASSSMVSAINLYRQSEGVLLRDALVVPLVQTSTPFAKAIHVKGFSPNLWDLHPWEKIHIR